MYALALLVIPNVTTALAASPPPVLGANIVVTGAVIEDSDTHRNFARGRTLKGQVFCVVSLEVSGKATIDLYNGGSTGLVPVDSLTPAPKRMGSCKPKATASVTPVAETSDEKLSRLLQAADTGDSIAKISLLNFYLEYGLYGPRDCMSAKHWVLNAHNSSDKIIMAQFPLIVRQFEERCDQFHQIEKILNRDATTFTKVILDDRWSTVIGWILNIKTISIFVLFIILAPIAAKRFLKSKYVFTSEYPKFFTPEMKVRFPKDKIYFVPSSMREALDIADNEPNVLIDENWPEAWDALLKRYPQPPKDDAEREKREARFWERQSDIWTIDNSAGRPAL